MAKQSEATLLLKIKSTGESVLAKTKAALGDLRTWAAAAFAALTSGAAVMAFKESEEATNKLNQALINQGIYTKELAGDYDKIAKELQRKTTFEDDSIKSAMASMQAYLGQTKVSNELMKATLDLAAAKKMDLASAAEMVAKSIGTGTNALARQGIELDKNASSSEKMTKVISELNSKFGGQAEAAANGLGALEQAKNAFGDLLEVVGEKFAPFIIMAAKAVTQLANDIAENQTVIDIFEGTLQTIVKVLAALKFEFLVVKDVIVTVFGTLFTAITAFNTGKFAEAKDAIVNGFSALPAQLAARWTTVQEELAAIDDIYNKQRRQKQDQEVEHTKKTKERQKEIEQKAALDREEFFKARSENEIRDEMTKNRLMNDERIRDINSRMTGEMNSTQYLEAELDKRLLLDTEFGKNRAENAKKAAEAAKEIEEKRKAAFMKMLSDMEGIQNSKSQIMVNIGKAAALANIAINTANAAMGAHAALDSIPYVGPELGILAAGSIIAMGGEKAAQVAGINLAEGGVIKATPGGVHAIIGEGGRDEAVIPLDKGGSMMGTTVNLVVYGGMLGDRNQAKEFAKVVDEELFRLRQSNESMAFDQGVI